MQKFKKRTVKLKPFLVRNWGLEFLKVLKNLYTVHSLQFPVFKFPIFGAGFPHFPILPRFSIKKSLSVLQFLTWRGGDIKYRSYRYIGNSRKWTVLLLFSKFIFWNECSNFVKKGAQRCSKKGLKLYLNFGNFYGKTFFAK